MVLTGMFFAISCGSSNGANDASVIRPVPGTVANNGGIDAAGYDSGVASPLCPSPTLCGGDIVGTWNLTGGCGALTNIEGCDRYYDVPVVGTVTFRSDGSYVFNVAAYSVVYKMADSCVVAQGRVCSGDICSPGGDGYCHCVFFNGLADNTSGAYATNGNALAFAPASTDAGNGSFIFDAQSMDYCVAGDKLTMVAKAGANTYDVTQVTIAAVKIN